MNYQPKEAMQSQRSIERAYSKLKIEPAAENRVNCYVCQHAKCGHVTKTIDIHQGVTPMMFTCEECGTMATSTFYKDIAPDQDPTIEWFVPELKVVLKMRKNLALIDHILRGGLEYRRIAK